ncbi:MAG: porin family protein [Algibacter sp.]
MKKKVLQLTMCFLMISTLSIAQNKMTLGMKIGGNFTGFHTGSSTFSSEFGINLGGIAEYTISNKFNLQAELLFNQKAGSFTIKDNSNVFLGNVISKIGYIDIPVLAKIYLGNKFSFEIGPQIGFKISEETEFNRNDLRPEIKTLDTAIVGGFGYQLEQGMFLQARYGYGLAEIFENENYKNSVISLSLGYKFK